MGGNNLRPTPTTVVDVMKSLTIIGMGTPSIAMEKCSMLFQPDFISNKIAIVAIDVVRCTSTLLACFAAGVRSVTVTVKGNEERGTTLSQSQLVSEKLGAELVIGGELKGLPIPGGVISNSPAEAAVCKTLAGKHLHFESSNFGKTFSAIAKMTYDFIQIGGDAQIFIASTSNTVSITDSLKAGGFNKIYFVCGGFYNGITLEDEFVAGEIIHGLNIDFIELDDEARMMSILYKSCNTYEERLAMISTNSVTKLLEKFDKQGDIETVLNGKDIPNDVWHKMTTIVPIVTWVNSIPVIEQQKK
ncbi:MAG: 2-phosphosulfolactate phosphatase [Bacteroidetes bacterium]|nr:2-phosphosulfolactate phosphatase [Bacteroidota bacterium]